MNDDRVDAVFSALSDPTRRTVMRAISDREEASATELASLIPVSRQAIIKHLTALSEAGLVTSERHGKQRRYRLTPRPLGEAMSWMAEVGAQWDERLESLRSHLNSRRPPD